MTPTQKVAMQQALDVINTYAAKAEHKRTHTDECKAQESIEALRDALAEPMVKPPFGSKRKAAMAVYVPPFRFGHGYIYDSQNKMVADDWQVEGAVASRVRGWGMLGYMPNGAALQDEIGEMIADALNAYYATQTKPVAEPVGYASIDDLHQLQTCNGMSVWCESPSMWGSKEQAPPPPENLVAIYTAPRPMHFQEPVAWAHDRFIENDDGMRIGTDEPELQWGKYAPDDGGCFPLYTSSQPPAEVPLLTDDEVALMWIEESFDTMSHESCYVRGIKRGEQAVRQKAGIK